MKYYAVKNGRETGIYETWEECLKQVKGFSNAQYKSFKTYQEASDYLNDTISIDNGLIAYVDGSFSKNTYGYGVVIIEHQKVIEQFYGKGNHEDYISMRNVAGEIAGALVAVEYAIKHNYKSIVIYYDYQGIEAWATGSWKANKKGTQEYVKRMQDYAKQISISFIKVLAHSGDIYNDLADSLAKRAVGIHERKNNSL